MTKDLALLVGPDQKWLTTEGFLDKVNKIHEKGDGVKTLRREVMQKGPKEIPARIPAPFCPVARCYSAALLCAFFCAYMAWSARAWRYRDCRPTSVQRRHRRS